MKFIDSLAKRFGYAKAPSRRNFQAAALNRLTAEWSTQSQTVDSILKMDLESLRARSREMSRNNPYVVKFSAMLKANVLGAGGLGLKNKAKEQDKVVGSKVIHGAFDSYANKVIEDNWREWSRRGNCTIDGMMSLREVQGMSLDCASIDGEALVRMHIGNTSLNRWGFGLEMIDSERLDLKHNEILPNGNVVKMGVELSNTTGRREAYWILSDTPNDYQFGYTHKGHKRVRVPADQMVHPYLLKYVGQTRGFPWLAPVMLNTKMLGGYEEAELVAARTAASKMAFLKQTGDATYNGADDGSGPMMEAEPGSIEMLPQGLEMQVLDWNHPNSNYGNFVKSALRGIAAGLNVSYNTLANDLEGVNFSSGRMGQMEEREQWTVLQQWLSDALMQPIYSAWLLSGLMTGAIGLPAGKIKKFDAATWRGRRWSWVDPTKEVNAKIMELNSGLTSLTRVLGELNIDRDELFSEIEDDKAALEARGIDLSEVWPETPDATPIDETKPPAK